MLGVALEDGKPAGGRDEVLCIGETLDVLADTMCGIEAADLPQLREELCRLSPAAFCN